MTTFSGRVWHSVVASRKASALDGAQHFEGRFHHDGQPALYMSPTPEYARLAIQVYVRPDDPPRVILPFLLSTAELFDLRDAEVQRRLGLRGHEASVNWRPERSAGLPATPWKASDAARAAEADGIIYSSRTDPTRWHLVLFRWNQPGAPQVVPDGSALPF